MRGFVKDIESLAIKNAAFCQGLYTARHGQLVVMAREEGAGEAVLDGIQTPIHAGLAGGRPYRDTLWSRHHPHHAPHRRGDNPATP